MALYLIYTMIDLKLPKSRFGPQTRLLRTLIDEIKHTIFRTTLHNRLKVHFCRHAQPNLKHFNANFGHDRKILYFILPRFREWKEDLRSIGVHSSTFASDPAKHDTIVRTEEQMYNLYVSILS